MDNSFLKPHKPKYIRKYDYLRSFYRPKSHWFYSTKDIEQYISAQIKKCYINFNNDLESDDEDSENNEEDHYSYFKENKQTSEDMDESDPKIIEGKIIDELAKKFIIQKFLNHKIYDFTNNKNDSEVLSKQCLEIVKNKQNAVLLQPTFISKNKKAITKPDALVISNQKIWLIEVKGTSNTKINHIFDLYFQTNVINSLLEDYDLCIDEYRLCVIKYDQCKIMNTNFILLDICSNAKSGFSPASKQLKEKLMGQYYDFASKIKMKAKIREGIKWNKNLEEENRTNVLISDYMNGEIRDSYNKIRQNLTCYVDDNVFWKTIDELYDFIPSNNLPNLEPQKEFKSKIKDTDYWLLLKDYYYYANGKYLPFEYSGKLFKFEEALAIYQKTKNHFHSSDEFIKKFNIESNTGNKLKSSPLCKYLFGIKNNQGIFNPNAINKFNELKPKKVYFDFESLNLALRVVDNYPPFMQTVNQVSVIFNHGNKKLITTNSIVIDPKDGINANDFKKIINAILPSKDLEECKKYSYVVYNKNFEVTRLNEMAEYINESEYYNKVNTINKNIYDLADLFNLSSNTNCAIVLKELRGYYSIKKVLPLVQKYDYESYLKAGCVDYKQDLVIHNGIDAQSVATKRFFNKISNKEWLYYQQNLGKYCDNDVRAMIAIEYFLEKLFNKQITIKNN